MGLIYAHMTITYEISYFVKQVLSKHMALVTIVVKQVGQFPINSQKIRIKNGLQTELVQVNNAGIVPLVPIIPCIFLR